MSKLSGEGNKYVGLSNTSSKYVFANSVREGQFVPWHVILDIEKVRAPDSDS